MQATYIIGGAKNNIILLEILWNENACMNKNKCLLCFNEFLGIEPTSLSLSCFFISIFFLVFMEIRLGYA